MTTNINHVAYSLQDKYDNLEIVFYDSLDFNRLFVDMREKYSVERITIQSGGTFNGKLLRENLID